MMLPLLLAVSLGMSSVSLPVDTLRVDSTVLLGVAIPAHVKYVQGDMNFDGEVRLSDVLTLAYHVLRGTPLPSNGDTLGVQLRLINTPVDSTKPADTVHYIFVPTEGIKR